MVKHLAIKYTLGSEYKSLTHFSKRPAAANGPLICTRFLLKDEPSLELTLFSIYLSNKMRSSVIFPLKERVLELPLCWKLWLHLSSPLVTWMPLVESELVDHRTPIGKKKTLSEYWNVLISTTMQLMFLLSRTSFVVFKHVVFNYIVK